MPVLEGLAVPALFINRPVLEHNELGAAGFQCVFLGKQRTFSPILSVLREDVCIARLSGVLETDY